RSIRQSQISSSVPTRRNGGGAKELAERQREAGRSHLQVTEMYKVGMLKLLTTVALLTVASVLDAAPLMPREPDAFGEPADGGNSNGRSTGKKNKMPVTDGNMKSTTATTIDSGEISPKASTDQMDPKLSGKAIKKSLPSAKKTNKRVCFWKYCSQN
ncbi:hypothetical protein cypCar_00021397, partial [Cyprinus carpio]